MFLLEWAAEQSRRIAEKIGPILATVSGFFRKVGRGLDVAWRWLYNFRKIFFAIPVAYAAIRLALYNMANLPEVVGVWLQEDGTYAFQFVREIAALGPLAITAFCLLMMFISRRTLTPWTVSVFSLLIPIFLLISNTYML
ncbi:MAG: hypothetical protein LUH51_03850 [Firmicutes bacterium]|nr:hypothetical protein [Bacillota bacterium]